MKKELACLLGIVIILINSNISAQNITTIAGNHTHGYSGDGGPATAAQLSYVNCVAVDSANNVYIADENYTIRKVNALGVISTFAGIADSVGYNGDNGPATAAKISYVYGIAFDKTGDVFISDGANCRIRKVNTSGIITTFAGNGSATISGIGGPATTAGIGHPKGICFDGSGNLYIATNEQILKVDAMNTISVYAGNGTSSYSGDGNQATAAGLFTPWQIQMDAIGNLYIADVANWRIRKVNTSGIITTVAGSGIEGFGGDGGPATSAKLDYGYGVFPDKCDNLYITDYNNYRVRMVNSKGVISTVAGNGYGAPGVGTGGYSGDGGPATAAEFNNPIAVYLDKTGNIYIADEYNFEVRRIQMDSCKNTTEAPILSATGDGLRVFPNPSQGDFTVNLSAAIGEAVLVTITDAVGTTVKELETTTNKETGVKLPVRAGVYFVRAATRSGTWVAKLVVE